MQLCGLESLWHKEIATKTRMYEVSLNRNVFISVINFCFPRDQNP